jgi:ABC-type transporter Mla subunit MlaD
MKFRGQKRGNLIVAVCETGIHNKDLNSHIEYAKVLHKMLNKSEKKALKELKSYAKKDELKNLNNINKLQKTNAASMHALETEIEALTTMVDYIQKRAEVLEGYKQQLVKESKQKNNKQIKGYIEQLNTPLEKLQKNINLCKSQIIPQHKQTLAKRKQMHEKIESRATLAKFAEISDNIDAKHINNER